MREQRYATSIMIFSLKKTDGPTVAGLGLLVAAILTLCHSASPVSDQFGHDIHIVFLVTALLCQIVSAVFERVRPSSWSLGRRRDNSAAAPAAFAGICCLTGISAYALIYAPTPSTVLMYVPGILFGLGSAILGLQWSYRYAGLEASTRNKAALQGCGAAVILFSFASAFPVAVQIPLALGEILASSFILIVTPSVSKAQGEEDKLTRRAEARSEAAALWRPLLGGLLCAFIIGLVWDPSLAGITSDPSGTRLHMLLAALIALAGGSTLHVLHRPSAPSANYGTLAMCLCAAVLLVLPSTDIGGTGWWQMVVAIARELCFFAMPLIAWLCCLHYGAARSTRTLRRTFALFVASLSAGMLVGVMAIPFAGAMGRNISLIALAAYLTVTLCTLVISMRKEGVPQEEGQRHGAREEGPPNAVDPFQTRCDTLVREGKLSPRETEVFGYLARGHSHAYVAQTLTVSENTIRTHVRNIYRKLGISSKEELLKTINEHT